MNNKYKFLFTILMFFMLVLQSVALTNVVAASTDEPITVGLSLSITGPFAGFMEYFRHGVELALEETNEAGGVNGRKIKLVTEDVASAAATAIASFKKLSTNHPEMVALIGSGVSSIVKPLLPYVKEEKIAYLSGACSPELHKYNNPYFFRIRPDDSVQARVITKFVVQELGQKKIAILYCTDEAGTGGMNVIKTTLADYGIKPLYVGAWSVGDKDFSAQLTRARASGAKAILGWGHLLEVSLMLRQMYQLGVKDSFDVVAGAPSFGFEDTIKMAPNGSNGVYSVIDTIATNPDPYSQKVRKAYNKKFKGDPNLQAFNGYDALQLVVAALKKMDTSKKDLSREEFRDNLASVKNYKGSMSTYSFDELNNGVHQVMIVHVVDGEAKMIKMLKE